MPFSFGPPLEGFPDRAHRQLLTHPHNLRELVEQAAAKAAGGLQFDRARLLNRDLPLPDWRRRENDLLFQVPFQSKKGGRAEEVLVGVLVEHQTKPDAAMPLRTLVYATAYWDQQWQTWEKLDEKGRPPLRLTPVLPIVFHAGPRRWGAQRALADLFEPPEPFRAHVPAWRPVFWHLFEQPADALRRAAGPWLRTMAVVRTDRMKPATFQAVCGEVAGGLEPLAGEDKLRWHDLMCFLIAWGRYRRPRQEWPALDGVTEQSIMNVALRKEVVKMGKTLESPFLEWAKEHYGAEGERRGALRNCRDNLRILLQDRFGSLSPTVVQRLESCEDLGRLQASVRQVSGMNSLDELDL